jgi:hypothetical protein
LAQYAEGAYLQEFLNRFAQTLLAFQFLLLVPSGKITAERWYFSMYSPNPFITGKLVLDLFYQSKQNTVS